MTRFVLLFLFLLFNSASVLLTQIVGPDMFIKGNYVELGISNCGAYGSSGMPPVGYHANAAGGMVGMLADPAHDGWTTGFPTRCGDYFYSGSPVEGWALSVNGSDAVNSHTSTLCPTPSYPYTVSGVSVSYYAGTDWDTAVWRGNFAGLNVNQYTMVPVDSGFILTKIVLTNTTAATIRNIYYSRNMDPENDYFTTGSFITKNTVAEQPDTLSAVSIVKAKGVTTGCYIGLATLDERARATVGGTLTQQADQTYTSPGTLGLAATEGYTLTSNTAISMSWKLDSVQTGDSIWFSFVYVLDSTELNAALGYIEKDCHPNYYFYTVSSCSPYTFNGTTLTTHGLYTDTLINYCGMDSVVQVYYMPAVSYSATATSAGYLTASSAGAAYQWLDCLAGMAPVPGATSKDFYPTSSGMYAVVVSSGTTCLDTSSCVTGLVAADEHFLQGNYVEVGIAPCGSYGSRYAPPAGYHPNTVTYPGIGYVADAAMDGWTTGTPGYCGDYFLPGSPVEGFSLSVDSTVYINGSICMSWDLIGENTMVMLGAAEDTAVWEVTVDSLHITQMTMVPTDSAYFLTRVTFENTSAADTINSLKYARNVDPDNEINWTGSFTTYNYVFDQPPPIGTKALVGATGLAYGCFLGIGTYDQSCRVSRGGFGLTSPENYLTLPTYSPAIGVGVTADEAIQAVWDVGVIVPGQSVTISFVHVMDTSQVAGALLRTGQPCFAPPVYVNDTVITCGSYTFGADVITTSGVYNKTLYTFEGCDSVVTLHLTILPELEDSVTSSGGILHAVTSGLTYQWVDCNAGYAPIAGETAQDFIPADPGNYAVIISNGLCTDTSACYPVLITGAQQPVALTVQLYPNPAEDELIIHLEPATSDMEVKIFNLLGEVVWERAYAHEMKITADLTALEAGVYFVKARSGDMEKVVKVVKQ